ncbi:MAG: DUF547 domain-containing protein [Candidatus Scalindua sp.]|nr:DUF547 domain-containing protein [Candidatus Scalindua sp.]MBT5305177.1 DUF547 domain-containing protein [Candidatus Scalindua sp.]MBT6052523.1 DUF547 domain-containing protein [Candidatus Scalindua sp.]MBT6228298.1 DUF547 domain-containing protein [Candidatus Scalindua sp.]MBT6562722.1 DUF547 domain-containing protein [Candidatus Scalindua sp.]
MKKIIIVFYIIFFVVPQVTFAEADNTFWDCYQDILNSVVTVNTFTSIDGDFSHASVDYEKIKSEPALQKKIMLQLKKLKIVKTPEGETYKLAFWINAYNFFTIVDVVNNYPVAGMKKIGWKSRHHEVEGVLYSLDNIEHNVIRPLADPRIHFAINCASVGCPSLKVEIFDGNRIDMQLNKVVVNALKNPLHLRMVNNRLNATQLFNWFSKDFESGGYGGVAGFVKRFAPKRLVGIQQIEKKIKYDWNLNTVQNVLKKMEELGTKLPELKLARKLIVGNVE